MYLRPFFRRDPLEYSRTGLAGPSGRSAAARSDSDDQKNDFRGFSEKKNRVHPGAYEDEILIFELTVFALSRFLRKPLKFKFEF